MNRKPIVLDDNQQLQQLQSQDELTVEERIHALENQMQSMKLFLAAYGLQIPDNLV